MAAALHHHLRRYRPVVAIALMLVVLAATCASWCAASPMVNAIQIRLELTGRSSDGRSYWEVRGLPKREAILRQVAEGSPVAGFVADLADWLDPATVGPDDPASPVTVGMPYDDFKDELDLFLDGRFNLPVEVDGLPIFPPSPSQVGSTIEKILKMTIPVQKIREVRLVLATAAMKTGNQHWIDVGDIPHVIPAERDKAVLKGPIPLKDLEARYRLGVTELSGGGGRPMRDAVRCWIGLAMRDIDGLASRASIPSDHAQTYLIDQLDRFAALMVQSLIRDCGIGPGVVYAGDPPTVDKIRSACWEIIGSYVRVRPITFTSEGVLTVVLEAFALPESVRIAVENADDKALTKDLNDHYTDERASQGLLDGQKLLTSPYRYPYQAAQDADREYLMRDPRVLHARWETEGRTGDATAGTPLVLQATPPKQMLRQLTLSAGFEYTPERDMTAMLAADFAKMTDTFEQLSVRLEGGEASFTGQGKVVVPFNDNINNRLRGPQLHLEAQNDTRDTYRFGNLTRGAISGNDATADMGLIWLYDSMTHRQRFEADRAVLRERGPWRKAGSFGGGLRARDFSYDDDTTATAGLDAGVAVTPYLDWHGTLFLDGRRSGFRRWQQELLIDSRLSLSFGTEALGSEFDYLKALFSVGPIMNVADRGTPAFFIEHRWQLGWMDDGAPTFDYLGSGEKGFVRGLEQDELIGRRYVAARTDAGVGMMWLVEWIRGRPEASQTQPDGLAGPLAQLYLSLFADFGWLDDRIVDGEPDSTTQALQGYGVQLRMMNFSIWNLPMVFACGYAYSPQAYLNESGVVFSEVSIAF